MLAALPPPVLAEETGTFQRSPLTSDTVMLLYCHSPPRPPPLHGEGAQRRGCRDEAQHTRPIPARGSGRALRGGQQLADEVDDKCCWLHRVVLRKQVAQVLRIHLAFGHKPEDSLEKERERR